MEELEDLPEDLDDNPPAGPLGGSLVGAPSMAPQHQGSRNLAEDAFTFRVLAAAAADLQLYADKQDPRVRLVC